MGAAMAVILANVWMKTFEPALSSEMPEPPKKSDNSCCKCGVKVNKLHQNLEFTIERQENGSLGVRQTGADVGTTW